MNKTTRDRIEQSPLLKALSEELIKTDKAYQILLKNHKEIEEEKKKN